jgi:hypothetical protein
MKWLKYSGLWVTFALNPMHWRISFEVQNPSDMDPAMTKIIGTVGPLTIRIVIDDGSY